jgi:nitroimidazol reductase NimA-like FMN-containing flavoprotein (pyridoxamine 5'-phosphate oxidase superfamily)
MKNRKISSRPEMEAIIRRCQSCCISMVDPEGKPYVIPMNFGFDGDYVYFHGSAKGKKVDVLKNQPDVCIAFSTDHELRYVDEEVACSWSMRYRSVLVHGKAEFVEAPEEKVRCLNIVMAHYSDRKFEFNDPSVKEVMAFKVKVDKMEGRIYGY